MMTPPAERGMAAERARGEGAGSEAASGHGHERTSRITMAASPVEQVGGSASGQARR